MALLTVFGTVAAQEKVTINGTIKDLPAGTWVYVNPASVAKATDSVKAFAGSFVLTVSIPENGGDMYVVHVGKDYKPGSYTGVYLDRGNITLAGNGPQFRDAKATGGVGNSALNEFEAFIKARPELADQENLQKKAMTLYKSHDTAALNALRPELERMDSLRMVAAQEWVTTHASSPISAYVLNAELGQIDADKRASIFASLTPEAKQNAPAVRLANSIRVESLTAVGEPALDFTQNDTAGKPISLHDFRGKFVLLDFWASWCGPCRAENPNVVAMFKKYEGKNFTVLSVSLDQPGKKQNWLDAIHKDQLTWTHVSDLKFWDNAVARMYDIRGIPANLLIDSKGVIVGKNLRGEDLAKKLHELLD